MAITLNNINFIRTSNLGSGTSIPVVRKSGMTESNMSNMISQISDSGELASALGAVHALEIDWNGAQWESESPSEPTVINTTGDLIKTINNSLYS